MSQRFCAVIPSRNHHRVISEIIRCLRVHDLPVFVIDDGSDEPARTALNALHDPADQTVVFRFDANQGKGGAVLMGLQIAADAGFTHAIQIDADGQHDLGAIPQLLAAARQNPNALVTGAPQFDETIPLSRRLGRWITHFWVAVELGSPRVVDAMCGFRVYPIEPTLAIARNERLGAGMEFDIEALIRLAWHGVEPIQIPVRVVYPPGNTSNFKVWRDNARISATHTRLILSLLARLPRKMFRHRHRQPSHWSTLAERGLYWGLRCAATIYRFGGPRLCLAVLSPVVFYFHATGREQRRASRLFLSRAYKAKGQNRPVGWRETYRHFRTFARKGVDTFGAWVTNGTSHTIELNDADAASEIRSKNRGMLLIVSHFGNAELGRAALDPDTQSRMTVLVHTRHAESYNRVLREFNPATAMNTIQVDGIGPDTIIALQGLIDRGHWVCIAGDRTPVHARDRVGTALFLGHLAQFPLGPYIIAHLLSCPVYLMFCLREGEKHRVYIEHFADKVSLPPRAKDAILNDLIRRYAKRLEAFCLRDPYQWYNFYDFWMTGETTPETSLK